MLIKRSTQALALFTALAHETGAVTSFSDDQMNTYLVNGTADLAHRYSPIWFFGQSGNNVPCYPTWAFGGSPTQDDVYDAAHKTPAAPQCGYPNVGCGCRHPDVPRGNAGPAFPIYYSVARCSDTQVRVAYNVFYEKDGAKFGLIQTGHNYDWERIIIVHSRNGDSTWQPSEALYSAHSGYNRYAWGDIQNTLSDADANAGAAINPNGVKNLDHPKAYVGWSKHPHFDDRNTGWNDVISQSDGNAFRSQDWWHLPELRHFIQSDGSTAAGKALGSVDFGSADSNPPKVHSKLCQE